MEHTVRKCQLIQAARDKRKGQSYQRRVVIMKSPEETSKDSEKPRRDTGRVPAWVDGVEVDDVLFDSGADDSLVSRGLVEKIKKAGVFVREATPKKPMAAYPMGNKRFDLIKKVKFEVVRLVTSQGPLVVRDLEFWVHEENKDIDLTIGRSVMISMGYTTDGLLTAARAARIEKGECMEGNEALSAGKKEMVDSPILRISSLQMKVLRAELERDGPDEKNTRVATPKIKPNQEAEVWKMLQKKVQEAQAGLKPELGEQLEKMLREHS
jgi:hypothetical protein